VTVIWLGNGTEAGPGGAAKAGDKKRYLPKKLILIKVIF
jgi:hypothetical protein